jgi:hypothetical protein
MDSRACVRFETVSGCRLRKGSRSALRCGLAIVLCLAGSACREAEKSAPGQAAAEASAGASSEASAASEAAMAAMAAAVSNSINPNGLAPYSGPVGAIRGVVTSSGDEPPLRPEQIEKLPASGCPRASEMYRKLFRLGPSGELADALVTVTEYQGFLQPDTKPVVVRGEGCAWNTRTVALTFGQRLEVENRDAEPYIPRLEGAPTLAMRIAMPGGAGVPLFAPQAGRYALVEQTRDYMRADVFILNYPTAKVTGYDGSFAFEGIPVGEVRVTAFLPATGKSVEQRIKVEAGVSKEVALQLPFSLAEFEQNRQR